MQIEEQSKYFGIAVIKVSVSARRAEFRKRLENLCFDFIQSVTSKEIAESRQILLSLKGLIAFGEMIYEIEPMNAAFLISEINAFEKNLNELFSVSHKAVEMDHQAEKLPRARKAKQESIQEEKKTIESAGLIAEFHNTAKDSIKEKDDNAAMRQSAIVDKIRQSAGNDAQLKDIVAAFPDVSDRTLRYDLERLCNQGIIERIGAGGPGTHYRIRII